MNREPRQVLTELLVLAAQGGSERAFKQLHDLWRADFWRMAMMRVERPEAADEIVNTVWLAIARGLRGLDDPACFPRWALRIVERRGADWIRGRTLERRREVEVAKEAELLAPAGAAEKSVPEDVAQLREAIARLPVDQRELVQLYYMMERSVAEIAAILDLAPGTVKSRLFSVRETLKQMLERKIV